MILTIALSMSVIDFIGSFIGSSTSHATPRMHSYWDEDMSLDLIMPHKNTKKYKKRMKYANFLNFYHIICKNA